MADDDQQQDGQQQGNPDAPRSNVISPDEESQLAFNTSQAAAQERGQAQAAFDTMRNRRAFTGALLSAKTPQAQQQAFRRSALGQNLEGAPPASQTP